MHDVGNEAAVGGQVTRAADGDAAGVAAAPALGEGHYRAIFESARDFAIFTTDLAGIVTSWNPGAHALLGWSEAEAIGRDACMIFTPEDQARDRCEAEMRTARDHGRAEDERWHRRRDGSLLWGSGLMMRLADDATGAHIGYLKMLRDRTAEHEAGRRLRESEALARTLFESSVDCVKLLDLDGQIRTMNGPGRDVMEIDDARAIVGAAWPSMWPAVLRDTVAAAVREAAAGRTARFEGFCPTAKGTPKWWDVQVSPVYGADGEVAMILSASRDMTDRASDQSALGESEARFRNLADHSPVIMWVTEADGYCSYLNQRWYEFTGQTEAEALGIGWTAATHPDDQALAEETFLAAVAGRAPFQIEYRLRCADGSYRWAIDAAAPRFGDDGRFLGHVGSVIDIDDRREAEEARRRAGDLLAAVMEAVPGVVYAKDLDGRMLAANRGTSDLVGKPLPAIVGRTDAEFLDDKEQAAIVMANDRRIMREDRAEVVEEQVSLPDGTRATWLSTKSPFRDAGGAVVGLVGSSIDITERKQAEERLRDMSATLEEQVAERTAEVDRMWTTSDDLMLVIGFDGVFARVNPAWTAILGYRADELVGRHVNEFVVADDHDATVGAYERAAGGERATITNRYRHKDGSTRWIAWNAAPGESMTYAVGRDITDDKLREEELQAAQEQLRQAQKMEAVGQLTGGLAHDFNNLLTAVTGGLELLGHRIAAGRYDQLDRYMNMALSGAQRAAALTQRLLAFSRRQTLAPTAVDTDRLVAGMTDIIDRTLGPSIDLHVAPTPGLWPVLVDAPQLENALLNLCINARDAMPDGGRLTIETGNQHLDARAAAAHELSAGDYVSLCVSDTGTGMTPDVIARVFDPFFTTKPIGEGTGLGLSMIYGFVRQSGGQVRIYSEFGEGTTMCLYLPRLVGADVVAEDDRAADPRALAEQGQTVLLVEDEGAIRDLVGEVLGDAGYRVLTAASGPQGVALLRSDERIDLLVTDVGLPGGLNGRQVADAGRAVRPGLRVLFVTGYAANAAVGAGHLDAGMAVMTKPFNIAELERRVGEMLAHQDRTGPT